MFNRNNNAVKKSVKRKIVPILLPIPNKSGILKSSKNCIPDETLPESRKKTRFPATKQRQVFSEFEL
jgi:hypothetical protein